MNNYLLLSFIISFCITVVLLIVSIPFLKKIKIGQSIREDGPSNHLLKKGTPTMGGIIVLIGFSISFIIVGITSLNLSIFNIFKFLFPCYIYMIMGFIDDFLIILYKNNKGISPKMKILTQIIGITLYYFIFLKDHPTTINLIKYEIDLGYFYFLFILLMFVATTNAVNITDGLDGLASGLLIICFIGTTILGLLYHMNDIVLFSIVVIASLMAFLIFNHNPAKIFMGNAGSLMFGAILSTIMVLLKEELMILIIASVFIMETLSVIIQVIYFKITNGKRVFLMAPLHHHYEKKGANEWTIDLIFWLFGLISLIILLLIILG